MTQGPSEEPAPPEEKSTSTLTSHMRFRFRPKPLTDIFTNDTSINRRDCKRVVPMKVLVLGLGRTGTASMRAALKRLGYSDTYHMMSASVENPPDCLMWIEAFENKYYGRGKFGREEWDCLLGHCQAVCDWPACCFGPELIRAYPHAKIILLGRDVEDWYSSALKTLYWRATEPQLRLLSNFDWASSYYHTMLLIFFKTFWEDNFPANAKRIFTNYYDEIRSIVPKEKLLEYRVKEGWEPLCRFLDVEVPQGEEFPNFNDTKSFVRRCKGRMRRQWGNVFVRWVFVGWEVWLLCAGFYVLLVGVRGLEFWVEVEIVVWDWLRN